MNETPKMDDLVESAVMDKLPESIVVADTAAHDHGQIASRAIAVRWLF